ncbi:fatty-acyl-CoA synthase [Desulfatibacillum alkenivorans DSM 16219]|jgi:fatty-acyl-CoA synthase|uniref:Fatty-acyl-CoA synthase n=1 Tax=Desulfatibacillum alkenivorans DSM 16219 TaxID=1121393 RepID=A0A1M6QBL8_9BACT|nr:acyl-CoA synthetase [Desulfatibacillum alkenivorans]SHK17571.1 fatty-acyl-CoA synthase [Desulfatibacillum alkenivorans DSM 16219]
MEELLIRGLDDIRALEDVPYQERVTEKSTYELLERGAAINPDATAMAFLMNGDTYENPIEITYAQFIGKIRQAANMFHDLGIGPEDVVTYILPSLPQTHYTLWGAETAGIANPINPLLEAATIKDICTAAKTKVMVCMGEMPGVDIWEKVDQIRKDIPTLEYVIRVMGPTDEAEKIYSFEEKIEQYPSDKLIFDREIDKEDIASLYHTGGTTGTPKLAKRTHYNEVVMAWMIQVMAGSKPEHTLMCGLPLFHCNGTIVTGLAPFSTGSRVVILSPMGYRDPSIMMNFYKIVEKYRPALFSAVPTVLSVLLDIPLNGADISSLEFVVCGAAPLSVELFRRFEEHTGMKILEGYGLTEGAVASCMNPKDGERKIGSIGLPMPFQRIKVVECNDDGEYVRDCEVGEIGNVCIKGPNVFKGYVEDAHNKNIWVPGGWFNTGDMGRLDADGYCWLTGRKKELIIRGGHNIDPAMIEEPLYKMPSVKMVAAVGRPDAHAGEVPVAYVEVAENSGLTEEQVMAWAKEHVGEKAAVPKEIVITPEIPLTPVGKIFKPALRWDATKRMYEKELEALGDLADSVEVAVGEHKVHGTIAEIKVKAASGQDAQAIKDKVSEILARYTVYHEVTVE